MKPTKTWRAWPIEIPALKRVVAAFGSSLPPPLMDRNVMSIVVHNRAQVSVTREMDQWELSLGKMMGEGGSGPMEKLARISLSRDALDPQALEEVLLTYGCLPQEWAGILKTIASVTLDGLEGQAVPSLDSFLKSFLIAVAVGPGTYLTAVQHWRRVRVQAGLRDDGFPWVLSHSADPRAELPTPGFRVDAEGLHLAALCVSAGKERTSLVF